MSNIMDSIEREIKGEVPVNTNLVRTENGALGFAECNSPMIDFFYKVSSMRRWDPEEKFDLFKKAMDSDPELAIRLLFFVRDVRGGLGERNTFRDVFARLDPILGSKLAKLVPEYGRWDDLLSILAGANRKVRETIYNLVYHQIMDDLRGAAAGKPISLLAKWMPSIRKVSKKQVELAKRLAKYGLHINEGTYRKILSTLRGHLKVVEKQMSANEWKAIDFQTVPSKAAKNYRNAFMKRATERYQEYLDKLERGEAKVNARTLYPYEIVASYRKGARFNGPENKLLEAQWKALPLPKGILSNAIVVRDGSGSMTTGVSGNATALDVATSLAILMAEHLQGPFKDRFITFSAEPRFVDLSDSTTLREKVEVAMNEAECSNTNIEATLDLILRAAQRNNLKQEEIPAVVIVSDMEFDSAIEREGHWCMDDKEAEEDNRVLFETLRGRWEAAGYKLPKMVFWNVASRTGTVPMQENENGLLLVSGFSQNIMDMLSGEGSMLDILKKKLCTERYDPVVKAVPWIKAAL